MSLTRVYQQELKKTRTAVESALRHHWQSLPDYRDDKIDGFVAKAVPIVEAGQRRAVALTDAYMSRILGTQPLGLNIDSLVGASVRNGVDPKDVYSRPFVTVWAAIATIGVQNAIDKGMNRLLSTGSMDVALSARDASVAYGQTSGRVGGFVRVADPGCCDFCQSIDGAKCYVDDPAPLHNNCSCTLEPIDSSSSDFSTSDFVSFSAGETFGNMQIEEHGELGPVITDKANSFTGPDELDKPDYIEQ